MVLFPPGLLSSEKCEDGLLKMSEKSKFDPYSTFGSMCEPDDCRTHPNANISKTIRSGLYLYLLTIVTAWQLLRISIAQIELVTQSVPCPSYPAVDDPMVPSVHRSAISQ